MNEVLSKENLVSIEDESSYLLSSDIFRKPISELLLNQVIKIAKDFSVKDTVKYMKDKGIGSLVVEHNGKVIGVITERDILNKVACTNSQWGNIPVFEIMTKDPQCLYSEDPIAYALNNMHIGGYRHIPILSSEGKVMWMLSIKDIVSWVCEYFPNELINITSEPYRGVPNRDIGG